MRLTDEVRENALVRALVRSLPRSARQRNRTGESDAELLSLPGLPDVFLAITVDALVEELETGLYRDPYLVGWMTVMSSMSDLAAVGADPLGILMSETLPPDATGAWRERLQLGVRDACAASGSCVLGGDTNRGARLHMESVAVGLVPANEVMLRSGCRPGHRLFASGPLGLGSAFAFEALTRPDSAPSVPFLPAARIRESTVLRRFASGCMDSSDGVIATLDELMRHSRTGFRVDVDLETVLHPAALSLAGQIGLPAWTMLAGPHGEFELIFTVPAEKCAEFLASARRMGWRPLPLGETRENPGLEISTDGGLRIDTTRVRNAGATAAEDVDTFVDALLESANPVRRP